MSPKFSVIIPVYSARDEGVPDVEMRHYRAKQVQRAIKSIIAQQFTDWELILVNDGCTDETPTILDKFAELDNRIRVISQPNQNRAIARNTGMDYATGEWLCWLDSDDEYSTHYLRELDVATRDFPEYKIFNFGSIIHFPDHHTSIRSVYPVEEEGDGHVWFRSGHIGCGSFIFKRELWLERGVRTVRILNDDNTVTLVEKECQINRIPDEVNPYEFAAASLFDMRYSPLGDPFQYENTENPDMTFQDGIYRHGSSLGNPWGDDFFQFFLLTRHNHAKPLDVLLYIQYPRAHEEIYKQFGEIYA